MAADGVNKLNLQLVHGARKHDVAVTLDAAETGDVLNAGHLAKRVAEVTGVPIEKQKLIFKGKSLTDPTLSLKILGLKDGSKVMLIGKKLSEEDERLIKTMNAIDDTVNKSDVKLNSITYEIDGVSQGYLGQEREMQALHKLSKRIAATGEELARQLEKLDALSLQDAAADVKNKRKTLATHINKSMDSCDRQTEKVKEMLEKSAS